MLTEQLDMWEQLKRLSRRLGWEVFISHGSIIIQIDGYENPMYSLEVAFGYVKGYNAGKSNK